MIDQQYNADLQPQPSAFYKKILFIFLATLLFISLLGSVLWYTGKSKDQPPQSPQPVFNPSTQVIPTGAVSLSVNAALNAFNFPQPLPFFDERNVVQSLGFPIDISASTTTQPADKGVAGGQNAISRTQPQNAFAPFLSYRILGQSREAIQTAFIEYFKSIGWKVADTRENQMLTFFSDAHQIATVTLLNAPSQGIIAALSMQ